MEHIPFPTKGISQESLLEIFISFRQAMTEWCKTGASPRATKASAELVKRELADFEPDIILATAPAPYLEIAYPEALLLYADGLYFRPPWPDGSPMFDPTGHQQAALIAQMAREISVDSSAPEFMDAYRGIVDRDMAALRAFTIGKIEFLRQRFNKIVVLGLQDFRHHFAFTAQPHETQLDFIIATLNRIPVTVGVIVAQHPDRHDIDTRTMSWLEAKFPNLINDPQFNALKGPSQSLMPFVDGLITTSSGLIYQAAIRLKPAFLTHPTNYSSMSHTRSLDAINEPSSFEIDTLQVDTQMAWILRHHAISHSFLLHTAWLHDRLMRLCDNKRRGNQTWREMPRIAGDATILDWLAKHLRPGIDAIPPV